MGKKRLLSAEKPTSNLRMRCMHDAGGGGIRRIVRISRVAGAYVSPISAPRASSSAAASGPPAAGSGADAFKLDSMLDRIIFLGASAWVARILTEAHVYPVGLSVGSMLDIRFGPKFGDVSGWLTGSLEAGLADSRAAKPSPTPRFDPGTVNPLIYSQMVQYSEDLVNDGQYAGIMMFASLLKQQYKHRNLFLARRKSVPDRQEADSFEEKCQVGSSASTILWNAAIEALKRGAHLAMDSTCVVRPCLSELAGVRVLRCVKIL